MTNKFNRWAVVVVSICILLTCAASLRSTKYRIKCAVLNSKLSELSNTADTIQSSYDTCQENLQKAEETIRGQEIDIEEYQYQLSEAEASLSYYTTVAEDAKKCNSELVATIEKLKNPTPLDMFDTNLSAFHITMISKNYLELVNTCNVYVFDESKMIALAFTKDIQVLDTPDTDCWVFDTSTLEVPEYKIEYKTEITEDVSKVTDGLFTYTPQGYVVLIYQPSYSVNFYFYFDASEEVELDATYYYEYIIDLIQNRLDVRIG